MPARGVQKRQRPAARVGAAGRLMPSGSGRELQQITAWRSPCPLPWPSQGRRRARRSSSGGIRNAADRGVDVLDRELLDGDFHVLREGPVAAGFHEVDPAARERAVLGAVHRTVLDQAALGFGELLLGDAVLTARASSSRRLASACLTFCGATIAPTDQWPRLPKRGSVMPLPAP